MSGLIRRALSSCWRNLALAGMAIYPQIPAEFARLACRRSIMDDVPGRAFADIELTPDERMLWEQLAELYR
jgi:hypothetical protein